MAQSQGRPHRSAHSLVLILSMACSRLFGPRIRPGPLDRSVALLGFLRIVLGITLRINEYRKNTWDATLIFLLDTTMLSMWSESAKA